MFSLCCFFFFQAEDGIRDLVRSRGLGDVYKRQDQDQHARHDQQAAVDAGKVEVDLAPVDASVGAHLSLIHI